MRFTRKLLRRAGCSQCGADLDEGLYLGETWDPPELVVESWWKGELDPICPDCAIARAEELADSTYAVVDILTLRSANA